MKNYITICLSLITFSFYSQNYVDVIKISGGTTSLNKFDSSTTKTRVNEFSADLTVPIKVNKSLSVISGLIYENIHTKLFSEEGIYKFGSTALKLGINKQFNERWSGLLILLPKIASDFSLPGSKDFQFGTLTTLKYKKRDNLNYKFGLYYNTELFGPFFVPLAGLYYLSPDKKFEANIMLPLQADLSYYVHSKCAIGFNFSGQMRSYHLTATDNQSLYLTKSTNDFSIYLKLNISRNLSFQTKFGHSLARSYRVYEEHDKVSFGLPATFIGQKRNQLNSDFSDGFILQVSLLYRFQLAKR